MVAGYICQPAVLGFGSGNLERSMKPKATLKERVIRAIKPFSNTVTKVTMPPNWNRLGLLHHSGTRTRIRSAKAQRFWWLGAGCATWEAIQLFPTHPQLNSTEATDRPCSVFVRILYKCRFSFQGEIRKNVRILIGHAKSGNFWAKITDYCNFKSSSLIRAITSPHSFRLL